MRASSSTLRVTSASVAPTAKAPSMQWMNATSPAFIASSIAFGLRTSWARPSWCSRASSSSTRLICCLRLVTYSGFGGAPYGTLRSISSNGSNSTDSTAPTCPSRRSSTVTAGAPPGPS